MAATQKILIKIISEVKCLSILIFGILVLFNSTAYAVGFDIRFTSIIPSELKFYDSNRQLVYDCNNCKSGQFTIQANTPFKMSIRIGNTFERIWVHQKTTEITIDSFHNLTVLNDSINDFYSTIKDLTKHRQKVLSILSETSSFEPEKGKKDSEKKLTTIRENFKAYHRFLELNNWRQFPDSYMFLSGFAYELAYFERSIFNIKQFEEYFSEIDSSLHHYDLYINSKNLLDNYVPKPVKWNVDDTFKVDIEYYKQLNGFMTDATIDNEKSNLILFIGNCWQDKHFINKINENKNATKFNLFAFHVQKNMDESTWRESIDSYNLKEWFNITDYKDELSLTVQKFNAINTPEVAIISKEKKLVKLKISIDEIEDYLNNYKN